MRRVVGLAGLALAWLLLAAPGPAMASPVAITEPAGEVSAAGATLRGHVDPAGGPAIYKCFFEYGTSTSYGSTALCQPEPPFTKATDVSAVVSGLEPGTEYHYRVVVVVEPSEVEFAYGSDETFCTVGPSCPASPGGTTGPINESPPATNNDGARCHDPVSGEPRLVVILMEGVDSVSPSDTYDPRKVPYCYTDPRGAKTRFPRSLQPLMDNFNPAYNPYGVGPMSMTDTLANHGGVMFLPWSFRGVYLNSTGIPYVHVVASSARDADRTPIANDAATLAQEVASVHKAWPGARIVILAHSLGGLIAEQYWEYYWRSHHNGVGRIIALDSPINGVKLAGDCAFPGAGKLAQLCANFSPDVYEFLKSLWLSIEWHDPAISSHDGDGAFLPVGTEGDFAYAAADGGSDTLLSQLLFRCAGWPIETCTPLAPTFLSPCPSTDHAAVKACPGVISYVEAASFGGRAGASAVGSRAVPTPPVGARGSEGAASEPARRSRDPLRRLVAGRPWAKPSVPLAAVGQPMMFAGAGLGELPGRVEFTMSGGGTTAASIRGWSDSSVQVDVPPGAVSGPVALSDAAGEAIPVGPVAVATGASKVDRLVAPARLRAAGGPAQLDVRALDGGKPAVGETVSLFDGYVERHEPTDRHGRVIFALEGAGRQSYVVHAGTLWRKVQVLWRPPPTYSIRLREQRRRATGRPQASVLVIVRKRGGRPATGVAVTVSAQGPRGPVLAPRRLETDDHGRLLVRVSWPRKSSAIVLARAGASSAQLQIR